MEPKIEINGRMLTEGQAMTLRVAIGSFISYIKENGLGDDQTGKDIARGYIDRGKEVLALMAI